VAQNNIPSKGNNSQSVLRTTTIAAASISGPIPPPQVLQQYEQIIPGGAERILKMAEKQSDHRMSLERDVVKWNIAKSKGGMITATIITFAALYTAKEIAIHGNPYAASALAALNIVGLIGVALYNANIQKAERNKTRNSSAIPPQ